MAVFTGLASEEMDVSALMSLSPCYDGIFGCVFGLILSRIVLLDVSTLRFGLASV